MRELCFRAWWPDAQKMDYDCDGLGITQDDEDLNSVIEGFQKECTLMQYTGLKDKHDKPIYEGDILKWFGYEVQNGKQIRPVRTEAITFDIDIVFKYKNLIEGNGTVEIIGNIYENPSPSEAKS